MSFERSILGAGGHTSCRLFFELAMEITNIVVCLIGCRLAAAAAAAAATRVALLVVETRPAAAALSAISTLLIASDKVDVSLILITKGRSELA